jgi:cytochrome c-type biogenesis protein CcmH
MTAFLLFAFLLFAIATAILLLPLLRSPGPADGDFSVAHQAATLAILKDQLLALEAEFAAGQLAAATFAEARADLQRRLLEEAGTPASRTSSSTASAAPRPASRSAAFVLGIMLLFALGGYAWLGNPAALDPAARTLPAPENMSLEQLESMLARLAAYLEENPEDAKGWLTLGRAYASLGRVAEAAQAFSRIEGKIAADPALLVEYAEILISRDGVLTGKPLELLQAALRLDPENTRALFLAGAAAHEAGDEKTAAEYWEKLLPRMEPGSEAHTLLKEKIDSFRGQKAKN